MAIETIANIYVVLLYAAACLGMVGVASLFYIEYYVGARGQYVLFGVMAWLLLGTYFLMISMSGGSNPLIKRGQIAWTIRATMTVIVPLLWIWIFLRWKAHVHIRWRDPDKGGA